MAGGDPQPPPKRCRRHSRPRPLGFSPFARTLLFSRSSSSIPSTASPEDAISREKQPKLSKKTESLLSSDEDDDFDLEDEEEEGQEAETVQVDFAFFDPKPRDFHGVKILLRGFLDDWEWDLGGFADLILQQTTVGTVVKEADREEDEEGAREDNDDDEDNGPFAVISALNLGRYAENKCIKEVKKFLTQKCGDKNKKKRLKLFLEDQAGDVGLLISQRFANCPHQLVPPLYDALFDEVSWATEDEPTQELRDSFCFKHYLLVTKFIEKKNANQSKSKVGDDGDETLVYIKAEDEIFHQMSEFSFTFHLHAEHPAPEELKNYKETGLVLVLKADRVPKFREKLKALFADS